MSQQMFNKDLLIDLSTDEQPLILQSLLEAEYNQLVLIRLLLDLSTDEQPLILQSLLEAEYNQLVLIRLLLFMTQEK